MVELPYSSVTPKSVYFSRRRFLAGASAAIGLGSGISFANTKLNAVKGPFSTTEKLTPYQDVTSYNNFYEFGTGKDDPVRNAKNFRTIPWTVSIEGAVAKPEVLDLDMLLKVAPLEERIYRHRCVEAWSIVVPWIGFLLSALIKVANPLSSAKYVAFPESVRSETDARGSQCGYSPSVRRGPADGRGDASACAPQCRIVRRSVAESKWRANTARRSVEVRF
jgi:sulfoxide reductase catalytic subunit YedY